MGSRPGPCICLLTVERDVARRVTRYLLIRPRFALPQAGVRCAQRANGDGYHPEGEHMMRLHEHWKRLREGGRSQMLLRCRAFHVLRPFCESF